jgi:hypothetical protein
MNSTDFERKLNLLIRGIENGLSEEKAKEGLENVLKYAIFPREKSLAQEKYSKAMKSRKCIAT